VRRGIINPDLELTERERFLNVFSYREVDHVPDVEFGYWEETLRRWHSEGLPRWVTDNYKADLYFGFEAWYWHKVPIRIPFRPFEYKVLREDERTMVVRDESGVVKVVFKSGSGVSIPKYVDFPVKDWDSWQEYKDRYDLDGIEYPEDWERLKEEYERRDYPLGVDAGGFFGWARNLMGLEGLCKAFYREPELVRDMMEFRTEMILRAIERAVREVRLDFASFWEDMCWRGGPLISPRLFREFILPCYKRVCDLLRSHGVRVLIVDSDGNIDALVPLWLEGGVNCFFPCEIAAGSDPVRLREKYGREALFMGGIDKRALIKGPKYIDRELERVRGLVEEGGYVPHVDHRVPADVPYSHYLYYLRRKRELIGLGAGRKA